MFKIVKQNVPTFKKASELINIKAHKPKKYISLMIVPSYSGSKTRSLCVPHAVFYGAVLCFISVALLILGIYLRNIYFVNMTENLSYTLEETIESFDEYRQEAEATRTSLVEDSLEIYEQLSSEQNRVQAEIENLEQQHQEEIDFVQDYIDMLENQIRELEEERLSILEFFTERGQMIPPIEGNVQRLAQSQENIIMRFVSENEIQTVPTVSLMGGTGYPLTEEGLRIQAEILLNDLALQHLLFEDIAAHRSQMEEYLLNYPTLMPIAGGQITSGFGGRRDPITGASSFHEGVDIPAPQGTSIHAAGGGIVVFEGYRNGYGNVVYIDHGGGISTRYAHNTRNLVTEGQRVERGDVIATVGSTGRSISMHLHYEVLRNGHQVDPVPFIWDEIAE